MITGRLREIVEANTRLLSPEEKRKLELRYDGPIPKDLLVGGHRSYQTRAMAACFSEFTRAARGAIHRMRKSKARTGMARAEQVEDLEFYLNERRRHLRWLLDLEN